MSGSDGGSGFISVKVSPDPGFALRFEQFVGVERLGRPFEYTLDVVSDTPKGDLTSLLGSSATVTVSKPDKSKRYFNGIITRARFVGMIRGGYRYRLELRPWIWLLSRRQDCRIFQKGGQTVYDIITTVFRDANFSDFSDKRNNDAGSQVLEYCVQYNETSLDFVTRLMEVYGLYYFFTHTDGKHTLVIAADPTSHTSIGAAIPYSYKETEFRTTDPHIWGWASELTLQPGSATFADYNFTTPSADLTGKSMQKGQHSWGDIDVFEYPGPHASKSDGDKLAGIRAQRFAAERQVLSGTSNNRDLLAGCKFSMSGFPDSKQNREYLLIEASYAMSGAEAVQGTAGAQADTFSCAFKAIVGNTNFRLDRVTPWPVMPGPQTAKVVADKDNTEKEVYTDQYGRIRVRFYWDHATAAATDPKSLNKEGNASCWIRVAQMWAGSQWGGMVIPRVGQEVVVEFLDGSPDRPIVTGCVYNAANTVPYGLPDNKTRSTFKSNSSEGGGGFNELRFEDKKGSEEVYFQAQKDYNKLVKNNETVTVDKGNRSYTLNEGNNSFTVSKGTNTYSIKGDNATTVTDGNNSLTVSKGNNTFTVSQGNNSLTVSQGNHSETISQGNYSISVTAGTTTIKSGQAITIQSNDSITLKVALSTVVINAQGVTVKGPKIALTANAELEADGGGMMTLKAGMININ